MRVLVLGVHGLLGHDLYRYLRERNATVFGTTRRNDPDFFARIRLKPAPLYHFDARDVHAIKRVIARCKPTAIVNCLANLRSAADQFDDAFLINTFVPLVLSDICRAHAIQFLHISTDGVFSGKQGPYDVGSIPDGDARDVYAVTKAAGEHVRWGTVLRSSIVGHSLAEPRTGILDWVVYGVEKELLGFSQYLWNGVTTLELSRHIERFLKRALQGARLFHCASAAVTKNQLIRSIIDVYELEKTTRPTARPKINRVLNPSRGCYSERPIEKQLREYRRWSHFGVG